ncbi:nuclease-related domain-containing protein [Actinomadura fibrosa]|uniref:Nuclease-related domain-containing protein n=1 Tax=Actinomadura fibrosa TaxID=111802 RepID=A0ABW2XM33_9ACTN|nr:nuclease-related domain-containing protein [Actinomadura fibrosa]
MSRAGASASVRYCALAARHRWERLAVRVVLACGTGVVAAGMGGWKAGLGAAVAVFAGHVVYVRVRPGPVTDWRRGARAERRTGRRLARLDPVGYRVLHDRALKGASGANLDHLVIGLTGVYAIASRHFAWGVRLRAEERRLLAGNRPVGGMAGVAGRAADEVAKLLSRELDCTIPVTPMVVVHGARIARDGFRHRDVVFCPARAVSQVIAGQPVIFTSAQVTTVAAAAERLLPPMLESITRK